MNFRTTTKPQKIVDTCTVNDRKYANAFLSLLEKSAGGTIEQVKLFTNDQIFDFITIEQLKVLGNTYLKNVKIIIFDELIVITDKEKQKLLIEKYHIDPIIGGHVGSKRLYAKLRMRYDWKNMAKQVAAYTRRCHQCQINKAKTRTIEQLRVTNTPQRCFDRIVVDTYGPLNKRNTYLLKVICDLSKYLICVPTATKEARTIAKAIIENVILIYGPVREILSDCGTEYKNQLLNEICNMLDIKQTHSVPYRPQSVGTIERNHRVMNEYFRTYISNQQRWEEYVKYYAFCFNTTPHTSFDFRFSPFELVFGKQPGIFPFTGSIDPVYNIDNYANEVKFKIQHAHKFAQELLHRTKVESKKLFDKNAKPIEYKLNDEVLLMDFTRSKLEPIYKGPYKVVGIDGTNLNLLEINTNKHYKTHKNKTVKYMK